MADALKDRNRLSLFAAMVVNLAVFYLAVQTDSILGGDWSKLVKQLAEGVPAAFGLILVGILNAQFSAEMKARIVFIRWRNTLPGSEAFTRHAKNSPQIDEAALERAHGPLPTDQSAQNALWYKMYRSVESDPAIIQAHRDFLFTRDYTCLALMMLVVLGGAGFYQIPSAATAWGYFALLIAQFLLAAQAARNYGRGFVINVLALKSIGR